MTNFIKYFLILLYFSSGSLFSQEKYRIISYNLENLFDYENDPLTDDDSFTASGAYQWNSNKYKTKLNNLSKAITAAGEWEIPALIGICEVENAKVINDLLNETQLNTTGYCFLHKDSPDLRGVDVALIYHPKKFKVISVNFLQIDIEKEKPTRDILFASGITPTGDTLHVFVNHWPSRYGGELESEYKRICAAKKLKQVTDSLFQINIKSKIIIMGDFNDYPSNNSLTKGLEAIKNQDQPISGKLYNLCDYLDKDGTIGSHKFEGKWGMLDQFIVSGELLNNDNSFHISPEKVHICRAPFLLKKDKTNDAPKRSFLGTLFTGGFSDHLPIYLDILMIK